MLGWEATEGTGKYKSAFMGEYFCFNLIKNCKNRPLNLKRVYRYAQTMVDEKWAGQGDSESTNGEPIILDVDGFIVSGAHRLLAVVLSKKTIEFVIIKGVSPKTADMVDTGDARKLGDVLYRRHLMNNEDDLSESKRIRLNKDLAVALRLVWLRSTGQKVSGGEKLSIPDSVAFGLQHPELVECVEKISEINGSHKNAISNLVSLGYAAAMMYLMKKSGADNADGKALEFWETFAQLSDRSITEKSEPCIAGLVFVLDKNARGDTKYSRDAICTLITRTWLAWTDAFNEWVGAKPLVKGLFQKVQGREVLNYVTMGGMDSGPNIPKETSDETNEPAAQPTLPKATVGKHSDKANGKASGKMKRREPDSKFPGGHKIGDLVWVDQGDGYTPWFGEIMEMEKMEYGWSITVKSKEENDKNQLYGCELEWLKIEKPESVGAK
jgi:hypothetical protein